MRAGVDIGNVKSRRRSSGRRCGSRRRSICALPLPHAAERSQEVIPMSARSARIIIPTTLCYAGLSNGLANFEIVRSISNEIFSRSF